MRVIEQQMCAAIRARRNMTRGNTRVEIANTLGNWRVYLHGNLIATGGSAGLSVTLAGWGTVTTRSRVNALLRAFAQGGAYVYQSKHAQHFAQWGEHRPVDSSEWIRPTTGGERAAAQGAEVRS